MMSWWWVLLAASLWLAVSCGIVAEKLRQNFYEFTTWLFTTAMLGFILLAVYASQHIF